MGSGARKHSIPTYGAMILHSSMKVVAIDDSNGDGVSLSYEEVVAMVERGEVGIFHTKQMLNQAQLHVKRFNGEVV